MFGRNREGNVGRGAGLLALFQIETTSCVAAHTPYVLSPPAIGPGPDAGGGCRRKPTGRLADRGGTAAATTGPELGAGIARVATAGLVDAEDLDVAREGGPRLRLAEALLAPEGAPLVALVQQAVVLRGVVHDLAPGAEVVRVLRGHVDHGGRPGARRAVVGDLRGDVRPGQAAVARGQDARGHLAEHLADAAEHLAERGVGLQAEGPELGGRLAVVVVHDVAALLMGSVVSTTTRVAPSRCRNPSIPLADECLDLFLSNG